MNSPTVTDRYIYQSPAVVQVELISQKVIPTTDGIIPGKDVKDIKDGQSLDNDDSCHNGGQARDIENHVASYVNMSMMTVMKISLKRLSWKLYLALLLTRLIPTVYRTTRVYYLGDLPDDSGVNIASQLTWVNLILEVVQEALILPLFYMIGITIDDERKTINRVKTGIAFTFLVHVIFAGVIAAAAVPMVQFMAQDENLLDETVAYIRLEMTAIPFNSVVQFVLVVFTLNRWQFHIYTILGVRLVLSVLLDTFFLSQFDFSLKLGVNGIAYGNIIVNSVMCLYCISVLVVKYHRRASCEGFLSEMSVSWMKMWGSVGFYSGLDSLIRNLFYLLCVVRMMNVIAEQGTYWLANEFIWNWLLLPYLPLTDVLKQDTGASTNPVIHHTIKTNGYTILTFFIAVLWCVSIPGWKPFFETVMNVHSDGVDAVYHLVLMLLLPYILFMLNTLMDSVFIGKGKTGMLAIQSIITNICVFGVSFVLYLCKVYQPTLTNITVLFGTSIAVDSLITTGLYIWYLKKVDWKI